MTGVSSQILNLLAALLLLLTFAMLGQRRILSLITLFMLHGIVVVVSALLIGYATSNHHLYFSAGLTLAVKVMLIPWILHKLVFRLKVKREVETLINVSVTMLIGIVLVIVAFNIALPVAALSSSVASGTLGIALACVLLSFMMILVRSNAIPQVIGYLTMENGLFFAATAATDGMPLLVELGVALAVIGGTLVVGLFMFQIREHFDDLDIHNLETRKED
jgi:hydrogenase-4 membrane subunit HyfE